MLSAGCGIRLEHYERFPHGLSDGGRVEVGCDDRLARGVIQESVEEILACAWGSYVELGGAVVSRIA